MYQTGFQTWYNSSTVALYNRQKNVIAKFIVELIAILEYNDVDDLTDYLRKLHYDAKNELRRKSIGKRNSNEDKNLSVIKKVSY